MRFVSRFVSLSDAQARGVVLWVAHTHAFDAADCTPYLAITSAEKQSGKTRLLEVLELLLENPWLTGRASAAVLIRKIDKERPTLLLDETDAAFGGEKEYAETLRGVLNSGYRLGGKASCCIGQGANITAKDFSTFCPKAIAGIGRLPDTVADRSIPLRLRRAQRGEVQRFRRREVEQEAASIKAGLAAWCEGNLTKLREAQPFVPEQLSDRQADCCEPLFAIADLAGGDWPERAREALVDLCCEAQADEQSIGVRLLADIRDTFQELGIDRIASEDLVNALVAVETSPWAEWSHGKPLTKSKLARLLGRYGITPGSVRFGDSTRKGYLCSDFEDAFRRYLSVEKRNSGTTRENTSETEDFQSGTDSQCSVSRNGQNPNKNAACSVVPGSNGNNGVGGLICSRCGNREQNLAAARYHYNRLCPMLSKHGEPLGRRV